MLRPLPAANCRRWYPHWIQRSVFEGVEILAGGELSALVESVNAHIRKAVRARGHFLNEVAVLKYVYTGIDRWRWICTGRRVERLPDRLQ